MINDISKKEYQIIVSTKLQKTETVGRQIYIDFINCYDKQSKFWHNILAGRIQVFVAKD